MTVIIVVEYLSVQAREPSRAGSRAYIEPSRASLPSSLSDRAEPSRAWLGSARFQAYLQPQRIKHGLGKLFPLYSRLGRDLDVYV